MDFQFDSVYQYPAFSGKPGEEGWRMGRVGGKKGHATANDRSFKLRRGEPGFASQPRAAKNTAGQFRFSDLWTGRTRKTDPDATYKFDG